MSTLRLETPFSLYFAPSLSRALLFSLAVAHSSFLRSSFRPRPSSHPPLDRPLPTTLAPTLSRRPSRESAFDRPEFFSTLESGALRAISRLVAGWSSPRKTPRKIVRSICLRSSGPKRTRKKENARSPEKKRERGTEWVSERAREKERGNGTPG